MAIVNALLVLIVPVLITTITSLYMALLYSYSLDNLYNILDI